MARITQKTPDGWDQLLSFGTVVEGTRIVPIKVPRASWDVKKFLSDQDDHKRDIGMIVDLTNTHYYDPRAIPRGIRHVKLMVRGHDCVPPKWVVEKFMKTMRDFHDARKNEHVAVHCTHGVNRTGYMVCCYLVEKHGFTVKQAIDAFAAARGVPMYNSLYIVSLFKKYNQLKSSDFASFEFPSYPPWAKLRSQERIAKKALSILQTAGVDTSKMMEALEQLRNTCSQKKIVQGNEMKDQTENQTEEQVEKEQETGDVADLEVEKEEPLPKETSDKETSDKETGDQETSDQETSDQDKESEKSIKTEKPHETLPEVSTPDEQQELREEPEKLTTGNRFHHPEPRKENKPQVKPFGNERNNRRRIPKNKKGNHAREQGKGKRKQYNHQNIHQYDHQYDYHYDHQYDYHYNHQNGYQNIHQYGYQHNRQNNHQYGHQYNHQHKHSQRLEFSKLRNTGKRSREENYNQTQRKPKKPRKK